MWDRYIIDLSTNKEIFDVTTYNDTSAAKNAEISAKSEKKKQELYKPCIVIYLVESNLAFAVVIKSLIFTRSEALR